MPFTCEAQSSRVWKTPSSTNLVPDRPLFSADTLSIIPDRAVSAASSQSLLTAVASGSSTALRLAGPNELPLRKLSRSSTELPPSEACLPSVGAQSRPAAIVLRTFNALTQDQRAGNSFGGALVETSCGRRATAGWKRRGASIEVCAGCEGVRQQELCKVRVHQLA